MKISSKMYAEALGQALNEQPQKHLEIAQNLLRQLNRNRARKQLPHILKHLKMGSIRQQATLITAVEFPTTITNDIVTKTLKKHSLPDSATIITQVEPDILGGFILQTADYEMDYSLRNKLSQIKEQLCQSS